MIQQTYGNHLQYQPYHLLLQTYCYIVLLYSSTVSRFCAFFLIGFFLVWKTSSPVFLLLSFLSFYLFPIWSLILTAEEYCSISILHTPCINTNSRSLMSRTTAVVSSICVSVFSWEWNKYACKVHPRFTAPLPFLKWNIYDPCRSMYPF